MVRVPLAKSWSLEHPERLNYIIANDDSYSQETYPHVAGLTLTGVQSTIQTTVTNRLRANNVDTSQISAASFGFLTAGVTETAETLDTFIQLLNNHMEVSDEDMILALQLRESTLEDVGQALGDTDGYGREIFYVRSWPILVEDLYRLIEDWEEDELNPEEVYHWLSPFLLLSKDKRASRTCYIRYVGKCEYPTVPYKRFVTDLKQQEGGLLCHFTTMLERKFPDSYTAGRAFEFTKATLEAFASPRIRDDRERIIIGFFGSGSLLNQQLGGYYGTYVPSSNDHTLFTSLGTRFFARFAQQSDVCGNGIITGLGQWIQCIQEITDTYPTETCTANHPMTEALLDTYRRQATPKTVNGHTVLLLIGKDITREDYLGNQPFLTGGSRAGALTRDFLARLESWENNHQGWDPAQLSRGLFPFVDLFPWPSLEPEDAALVQLTTYLHAIRPLLMATFSTKVNSYAAANFYHYYGILPRTKALDIVGLPRLQHYAPRHWLNSKTITQAPAGFSTIMVPHYHPGYDKYGSQPTELRRIFDIAWMITLFIADKLVQEASKTTAAANHDSIVNTVWSVVDPDSVRLDPKLLKVYQVLKQAKTDYDNYLTKARTICRHQSL